MSLTKYLIAQAIADYVEGLSIPQVSAKRGIARSTIRFAVKRAGLLRSRTEGVQMAAKQGRLGGGLRGKSRTFSKVHRERIAKAARQRLRGYHGWFC